MKEEKQTEDKQEITPKEKPSENQKTEQNKELKKILLIVGAVFIVFLLTVFVISSIRHFEYKEIKWNVVKEKDIIFYNTIFPFYNSITGKHIADYNVYIRNDPRKLGQNIPFEGKLNLRNNLVIRSTEDFDCDGDGVIAVANLVKIFGSLGTNIFKNESYGCDPNGNYMFVNIQSGDKTKIEQYEQTCYNLNVNNCEILDVTERFLIEGLMKFNE